MLFVGHTRVSLRVLRRVHRLLAADPRLDLSLTLAPDRYAAGRDREALAWGLPVLPYPDCADRPWDLVLLASHGGAHLFDRAGATVFVPHGVGAGKAAEGADFTYGARFTLRDGRPIYTVMLEASEEGRRQALRTTPELAGTVEVVGELETDEFLGLARHRDTARELLGAEPEDRVLLVSATWGDGGLLGRDGPRLLASAAGLPVRVRVLLRAHPHNWDDTGRPVGHLAAALAAAPDTVRVVPPWQPWLGAYLAADLAVYDFGSLALRFALLPRPMVAVPVEAGTVTPGSRMAALRAVTPPLPEPSLPRAVEVADRVGVPAGLAALGPSITSHPGQAAARIRRVLYGLLGTPPPDPEG